MQTRTASGCIMRRGIPCMERIPTLIRPLELTLRVGSQARTIIAAFCGSCMQAGSSRRRRCQADGGRWFLFGIVCCLGQSRVWNGACRGILSVPDVTSKWERAKDCAWTISEYGAYVWNVPLYGSMIGSRRPDL